MKRERIPAPGGEVISDHCKSLRRKKETNLNGGPSSKTQRQRERNRKSRNEGMDSWEWGRNANGV